MKFKKKTAILLSFAVGTVMFATTALAEVVSKNGYDQIKDSLKYTAEGCTTKLSSYTADMSVVVKDNGNVLFSDTSTNKYDISNKSRENLSKSLDNGTQRENYYYADKNGFINKSNDQDIYYVNEYTSPKQDINFKNPFKDKQAGDVERIADALIGNLKDAVVVTQNSDGSKQLSGSLSESQIPSLINAVVSLQCKNVFGNNGNNTLPKITKDIFVKEVKGNMTVTKDGLVQVVLGTGVISGKDDNDKDHNLTFEILGKISNVNSTVVKKLDLSGKKTQKNIEKADNGVSNPEKYIGKYKNNIAIEKDGKFQKIGEQFVDITAINDKSVSGSYHEEYAKGYEEYGTNKKDFKFDGKFEDKNHNGNITATDSSGNTIKGHISINQHSTEIYFNINNRRQNTISNDSFTRVFD